MPDTERTGNPLTIMKTEPLSIQVQPGMHVWGMEDNGETVHKLVRC